MNKKAIRRQSYSARLVRKTFKSWGARIGILWICVLALVAVLSPLLASSFPLLVESSGQWQSPVLKHMTSADFTWLAAFLFWLLLLPFRVGFLKKVLFISLVSVAIYFIASSIVRPPELVIYETYRTAEYQQSYDRVIYAPIPYSPKDYLRDQGDTGFIKPGFEHWFGTEENGADVLSRMIHASRIALGIGFVATGIAMVIGIIVGGLMGYFSGITDMIGMRLVEIFEAIPTLFLLLAFVAFFGRSLYIMMVIIGLTSWPGFARYIRAEFLKLREQDYIQAAIASGLPLRSILFRHMLPNGMAPVLVAASFGVASAILAEATLSFLGLGLVDAPSWGQMLNQAVQSSSFNWWMAAFPGGAIFLTVFAYNLIGDALRDAIDPYLSTSV